LNVGHAVTNCQVHTHTPHDYTIEIWDLLTLSDSLANMFSLVLAWLSFILQFLNQQLLSRKSTILVDVKLWKICMMLLLRKNCMFLHTFL
jgi:hypothetical protein